MIQQKHYISFPVVDNIYLGADYFMKDRKYYERLYAKYPDVVTTAQLCKMLGGIADSTARKLIRSNHIKHYQIRRSYLIPKFCVIDYVLSDHYYKYRDHLSAWV